MLTIFKWVGGFLLTLALLLVAAAFIVPRVFDAEQVRATIIELVQQQTGRELRLDGDLSYSVFPWLGLHVQQLSYSQPQQIGDQQGPMLQVGSAQLRIKLLPLLSRQLEVDTVILEQPQLRLITLPDGTSSFSGLLGESDQREPDQANDAAVAVALVVQGLELSDGSAVWDDRQAGDKYTLSELNLNTGNLIGEQLADFTVSGVAADASDLQQIEFELGGQAKIDTGTLTIEAQELVGAATQGKQWLKLKLDELRVEQDLQIRAAELNLKSSFTSPSEGDVDDIIDSELDVRAITMDTVSGKLTLEGSHLTADIKLHEQPQIETSVEVPSLQFTSQSGQLAASELSVTGSLKDRPFKLSASSLKANVNSQKATAAKVTIVSKDLVATVPQLELSGFTKKPRASGALALEPFDAAQVLDDFEFDFVPSDDTALRSVSLRSDFVASTERIDLNTLILQLDESRLQGDFSARHFDKPKLDFNLNLDSLNLDRYMPADEKASAADGRVAGSEALAVPMALFKDLTANGFFKANKLISGGLEFNDIDVEIKSTPGSVAIVPKAKLYDGELGGSMVFTERADESTLRIKNEIDLISLGNFLNAADVTDQLSGIGSMVLDLTVTERDGEQHNSGTIKLLAKNGAIKGVDVKSIIDSGYQKYLALRGKQVETEEGKSTTSEETKFAELLGTFNISDFKLSNRDFSMKAPLFRIAGEGDIDIAEQSLNYLLNVSIVNTSSGQGGAALDELKGITLPIRLRGSLLAPDYSLDMKAMYKGLLAKEIEQKKSEFLEEELGIEEGGKLSTKDLLREVLIRKVDEKIRKDQPDDVITAEPKQNSPESPAEQQEQTPNPAPGPAASQTVPDVQADPNAEASTEPVEDQRSAEEKAKDELKERLLEELFD